MLKSVSSNWALNALQILVFMALARFTLTALGQGNNVIDLEYRFTLSIFVGRHSCTAIMLTVIL